MMVSFASPILMIASGGVFLAILIVVAMQKSAMPRLAALLILAGAFLLALACGRPSISLQEPRTITVLVDQSASTRTAGYRDAAALQRRIAQLLGNTPHQATPFANESAEQTTLPQPSPLPDAVVLFSDGQFTVPQSTMAPTYVVIDPQLGQPADAAIRTIDLRDGQAVTSISNRGKERSLKVGPATLPVPPGDQVIPSPIEASAAAITAALNAGDPWPENDTLTFQPPPPAELARWWVGDAPPSGWRAMSAAELPSEAAAYLAASTIVLNNIAADTLSQTQQDRLTQYVRDLGGGLVMIGGDHAFAAGRYMGSALEALSPLSVTAPESQRHWILLVDASGSMATELQPGFTRYNRAALAISQLVPNLPPNDLISIASFSSDLTWWVEGSTVEAARKLPMPPPGIRPTGATNLEDVLDAVTMRWVTLSRLEVIVASDADATFKDANGLTARLRARQARISLLATADPSKSNVLRIVALTGGNYATELNPLLWADAAKKLARAAVPDRVERIPLPVAFTDKLSELPQRQVDLWNRTWLKNGATLLASSGNEAGRTPMAARWQVGAGSVVAAAFPAAPAEVEAMVALAARAPRDPRFVVSHEIGPTLKIAVVAADGQKPLNEQSLSVGLSDLSNSTPRLTTYTMSQTAPGRYEASIPSQRASTLVTVRLGDIAIDRFAVAGRYPAEFDAIGNNHANMQQLATMTGGRVIEPSQTTPIDFAWPVKKVPLTPWLAIAGGLAMTLGLVSWKSRSVVR